MILIRLSLNISESDNALSLDLAMEVHPYFRLREEEALEIMTEVKEAAQTWREVANQYKISRTEQALKARAFSAIGS